MQQHLLERVTSVLMLQQVDSAESIKKKKKERKNAKICFLLLL